MTADTPVTLDVVADRLGALAWVSEALFGLQGRWAPTMADDGAAAHLATASRRKGWHVELLVDLLPDSPALHGSDRVAAPPGWTIALSHCADVTGDPARLGVLYRALVPRLAAAVSRTQRAATGPGDGAIARALGFVAADLNDDLVGGAALLEAVLADDDAVRGAHDAVLPLDLAFANG